jgi:hypothetical protein
VAGFRSKKVARGVFAEIPHSDILSILISVSKCCGLNVNYINPTGAQYKLWLLWAVFILMSYFHIVGN